MDRKNHLSAYSAAILFGFVGSASVAQAKSHHHVGGSEAYDHVVEGAATDPREAAPKGGKFLNGTFIPRGTSAAQKPSHPSEPE
jgi:hypothetical protein